jgi:hypothetical protein
VPPVPPVPPTPPAPIPDAGLRVLIVYESAKLSSLPPAQYLILTSTAFRTAMDSTCVKVGSQPEWRIYDKDASVANESPIWQKAMARPRASHPWILVSNGKSGFEGPLPATVEDTLALVKKYGG